MIRSFFLVTILLLSASCVQEEIASYDRLTPDEQTAIQNRSQEICLSDSATHFSDFTTGSDDNFYGSSAYAVGTTFNHSFSEVTGTTTTARYTHKITVWKVTTTDVYLLIDIDDTTDEYQFLKIPKTTNDAMITDLKTKLCDRSATRDTTLTITISSKTYKKVTTGTTKEVTATFTYSQSLVAFLSRYVETRKEQPLDTNGNATGTVTTYTGTLSSATTETNIPKYDTYAEYVATGIKTSTCLVVYTRFPYEVKCDETGATTFLSSEL